MFMTIHKHKMAFFDINDINSEILARVFNFKLFINLSILDKKSYILITNTLIYAELNILKNHTKLKEMNIEIMCYKLGLINILKKKIKNIFFQIMV